MNQHILQVNILAADDSWQPKEPTRPLGFIGRLDIMEQHLFLENVFENVVRKLAAILSQPQCVNDTKWPLLIYQEVLCHLPKGNFTNNAQDINLENVLKNLKKKNAHLG